MTFLKAFLGGVFQQNQCTIQKRYKDPGTGNPGRVQRRRERRSILYRSNSQDTAMSRTRRETVHFETGWGEPKKREEVRG